MRGNEDPRSIEDVREDNLEDMAERMREVEEKTKEYEYVKIVEMKYEDESETNKVPTTEYVYWREIGDLREFVPRLEFARSYEYLTIEEFTQEVAEELNSEQA